MSGGQAGRENELDYELCPAEDQFDLFAPGDA
jgi:hypothetical protein